MTRNEMLELAALDAFGLLDEYETDLYTRSFHHIAATVQDEILELQARIVSDPELLPADLPPDRLRETVLARVAAAVEAEVSELAPLATIGRPRTLAAGTSPGATPARHRATVSRQFWRAAAFLLLAAVAVLGHLLLESNKHIREMTKLVLQDINSAQLERLIGGEMVRDYLSNPAFQHVAMTPMDPDAKYWAAVLTTEGFQRGILVIDGLPIGTGYELRIRDANGSRAVHEFDNILPRSGGIEFAMRRNVAVGPNTVWEIRRDGELLLASA